MPGELHDPYRQWLGITSENRPLNHYELLGLPVYESNEKKIKAAIDSKVSILQMVTGNDAPTAEQILKEIGQARACLLDIDAKSNYDNGLKNKEKSGKSNRGERRKRAWKDSPPPSGEVSIASGDSPDNIQSRIKSQKVKERQDRQLKVILDRAMWISCGICVLAIGWVMTSRISGCNQESTKIAKSDQSKSEAAINAKKIFPQKKLDRSLISPLEKEAKGKLLDSNSKQNQKEKQDSKEKKSQIKGRSRKSVNPFENIKETIALYDFGEPVNKDDQLAGLAPLRLRNVKWSKGSKGSKGGVIRIDANSRVEILNEKAFDTIKKITVLIGFKTGETSRNQCLISIKGDLVVMLDQGVLKVVGKGNDSVDYRSQKGLADGRWHNLAITVGDRTRIWVDGEFVNTGALKLPEFSKSDRPSEVGRLTGTEKSEFTGQLHRIGLYWIELNQNQIRSQFSTK